MNFPWVIRLARENASSVAGLRLLGGLEVAEDETSLWLRGPGGDDSLDRKLAALPACERFEMIEGNRLRRVDRRVPSDELPPLSWQPLNAWLRVELPPAAPPGIQPDGIPLRLVRSAVEREPELLLTTASEFARFAANAAQIRLDRLQFAADGRGFVLVRGKPQPPLSGQRFVLHGCVAVAAGFYWAPVVSDEVLARRLGVSGESLVLWNEDGTITRLHAEQFVAATRGAARATAECAAHDR